MHRFHLPVKSALLYSYNICVQSLLLMLHYYCCYWIQSICTISVCKYSRAKFELSYSVLFITLGVSNVMHLLSFLFILDCCTNLNSTNTVVWKKESWILDLYSMYAGLGKPFIQSNLDIFYFIYRDIQYCAKILCAQFFFVQILS